MPFPKRREAHSEELLAILYRAAASPLGLRVAVSDVDRALNKCMRLFYEERDAHAPEPNPLGSLLFRQSPTNPTEIWILNRRPTKEETK